MTTKTRIQVDVLTNEAGDLVGVCIGGPAIPIPLDEPAPRRLRRELVEAATRARAEQPEQSP